MCLNQRADVLFDGGRQQLDTWLQHKKRTRDSAKNFVRHGYHGAIEQRGSMLNTFEQDGTLNLRSSYPVASDIHHLI
jgi:hypothetical protein